jgi:hypothetical protein
MSFEERTPVRAGHHRSSGAISFRHHGDRWRQSCRVLSLNASSGEVLWNKEVFQQVPRRKESRNTYASPTPATDGERVYA